jgi:hypothetical protein
MNLEDQLQARIIVWFKNEYQMHGKGLIFSVPNGGSRNGFEAKKLKTTGLMPGVSDLIVILTDHVIFIELKTEKGIQSEAQKVFENKITSLGYEYHLIRDIETFKKLIYDKTGKQGV